MIGLCRNCLEEKAIMVKLEAVRVFSGGPFFYKLLFGWKEESEMVQLYLALCNRMNCSPPGSSIHRIFQARILEWVTITFSRGSSLPRYRTRVSCAAGRLFTVWVTREALLFDWLLILFSIVLDVKGFDMFLEQKNIHTRPSSKSVLNLSLPSVQEKWKDNACILLCLLYNHIHWH